MRNDDNITAQRPRRESTTAEETTQSRNIGKRSSERRRRNINSRKRRKRNLGLKVLVFVILIIGIVAAAILWRRYSPSKEKADLNRYYGIEQENQLAIVIDDQKLDEKGIVIDGVPYVDFSVVKTYINDRFYWDISENRLLYTLPRDVVSVGVGSTEFAVSKERQDAGYVIVKTEGNVTYVALEFLKKYTDMDFRVYEEPSRVVIEKALGDIQTATLKRDTAVRWRGGVKSAILSEVKKNDTVIFLEDLKDWYKVRTEDGFFGYIQSSAIREIKGTTITRTFEEEEYTSISKDYTINLAWHQVTTKAANATVYETLAKTKGVTTVSPTWFSIVDNDGNISSLASSEYVNYAHQLGIEVWGLVDDFNPDIDLFELLSSTSKRENLTNQLIAEVLQVGMDGINIDFEMIRPEDGEHFIQFIRELSVMCRKNGIVLSVDNYVPIGNTNHYNRKEQGVFVDYIVIMGYDEHHGRSMESGSVASLPFVRTGIENTIKEVPAEKVINGMPFYTRLWKEEPKTAEELAEQAGTPAAEYPLKVTSEIYGMSGSLRMIAERGIETEWDAEAGQEYAQWEDGDAVYKIWLENEASIEEKMKLMKEYNIAGCAVWKLGLEREAVWDVILRYVN